MEEVKTKVKKLFRLEHENDSDYEGEKMEVKGRSSSHNDSDVTSSLIMKGV